MAIPDKEERGRRLQAYYKGWDGLMAARSGLRAVPKPTGPHNSVLMPHRVMLHVRCMRCHVATCHVSIKIYSSLKLCVPS